MNLMDYLESAKKSLFRFEYLQDFNIPEEKDDFETYKKTGKFDPTMMKEWWNFLESKQREGVIAQRVRLVREPFTKYTEWEIEIYKETIKHGDEIKTLSEDKLTTALDELKDFWIIDDSIVLSIKYTSIGEYLGFEKVVNIDTYLNAKRYLLENSVPL